jgi:CelD/BcsL family acetyltransferase involved in cellulose biosynthesis
MTWTLYPADQFAAHARQWQQLNDESAMSPLLDLEFVQPLLAEFGSGKELLARYERHGQLLAMTIMTPRRRGVWQTFQPSQAPIGMWINRQGVALEPLLDELIRTLPGFPLMLGLTQRDPDMAPRPPDNGALRALNYIETSKITLQGSFEDYWNGRGKNLRTNMKKQRAKLQKEGIVARLQCSRAPSDVAAAIADYGMLESAGWKAQGGTAIHADNDQGRYYQAMLEGFCRRGAATINRYWFDDKLVAMNLCIEGDGSLIILKTSYDESVNSQYSPAFLMLEETVQQLYAERKFDRLEFYGKVMEWHRRWTDEVRTMYHINSYRWPALLQLHTVVNNRITILNRLRAPVLAQPPAVQNGKPSTE